MDKREATFQEAGKKDEWMKKMFRGKENDRNLPQMCCLFEIKNQKKECDIRLKFWEKREGVKRDDSYVYLS